MPSAVDLAVVGGDGCAQARGGIPVESRRQERAEDACLRAVIGQSDAQPFSGEPIPLGVRDALDEASQPEPAQVVGHPAGAVVVERQTAQRRHRFAQLPVAEASGQQVETQQGGQQRVDPRVAEAQGRGALPSTSDGRCSV